ncbi:hypothetical protein AURDEDRAFT_165743 [Auricularia subglabra TFB-10046 SS5]|nr:hypothetical protein AURDEDRAFT_165743 [Auricularia subglabra TFB-10046 SS5]
MAATATATATATAAGQAPVPAPGLEPAAAAAELSTSRTGGLVPRSVSRHPWPGSRMYQEPRMTRRRRRRGRDYRPSPPCPLAAAVPGVAVPRTVLAEDEGFPGSPRSLPFLSVISLWPCAPHHSDAHVALFVHGCPILDNLLVIANELRRWGGAGLPQ